MPTRNVIPAATVEQGLYVAYASLIAMAFVPISFGSLASLKKWKNPDMKKRIIKAQINESDELDEDAPSELISAYDAYMFPVVGSVALYGLYQASVHWDRTIVNYALTSYFAVMSVMATAQVGVNIFSLIARLLGIRVEYWHINLARKSKEFYSARFTVIHLAMIVISTLLSAYYAVTKNWIVSNIFAVSFAFSAVQLFTLNSFGTGIALLAAMFLCEASWNFSSQVKALTLFARHLDLPIKITFPHLLFGLPAGQAYEFASVNLGDIVIPGVFVAFCLRFDQHRAGSKDPELGRSKGFRKPYFVACLVAYILGLGASFYIMHISKAPQPALMFISPACILSVLMTAGVRNEMKQVFAFTSEEGLAVIRAKKVAEEKQRKLKAQALAQSSRYARLGRLPNVIREENLAPPRSTAATTASETSSPVMN
ncbi:hypothetical protein BGZ76_010917 [Entomortierella beljakovae]|nr:hypothetical protein BGZ76_010917 [Entomortierella beljakovae]